MEGEHRFKSVVITNKAEKDVTVIVIFAENKQDKGRIKRKQKVAPNDTYTFPEEEKPVFTVDAKIGRLGGKIDLPDFDTTCLEFEVKVDGRKLVTTAIRTTNKIRSEGTPVKNLVVTNGSEDDNSVIAVRVAYREQGAEQVEEVEKEVKPGETIEFEQPNEAKLITGVLASCGGAQGKIGIPHTDGDVFGRVELEIKSTTNGFAAKVIRKENLQESQAHEATTFKNLKVTNTSEEQEILVVVCFADSADDEERKLEKESLPATETKTYTVSDKPIFELQAFVDGEGVVIHLPTPLEGETDLTVELNGDTGKVEAKVLRTQKVQKPPSQPAIPPPQSKGPRDHPPTTIHTVQFRNQCEMTITGIVTFANGHEDANLDVVTVPLEAGQEHTLPKHEGQPVHDIEAFLGRAGGYVNVPDMSGTVACLVVTFVPEGKGFRAKVVGKHMENDGADLDDPLWHTKIKTNVKCLQVCNVGTENNVSVEVRLALGPDDEEPTILEEVIEPNQSIEVTPEDDTFVMGLRASSDHGEGYINLPLVEDRLDQLDVLIKADEDGLKSVVQRKRQEIKEFKAGKRPSTKIRSVKIRNTSTNHDAEVTVRYGKNEKDRKKIEVKHVIPKGEEHLFPKQKKPIYDVVALWAGKEKEVVPLPYTKNEIELYDLTLVKQTQQL